MGVRHQGPFWTRTITYTEKKKGKGRGRVEIRGRRQAKVFILEDNLLYFRL